MKTGLDTNEYIQRDEYELGLIINRLRREVFQKKDPSTNLKLIEELSKAEHALKELAIRKKEVGDDGSGLILDTTNASGSRGLTTTGIEAKVYLKMAYVPTSFYHLLNRDENPLLTCEVTAVNGKASIYAEKRRVRVTSFIEGYSARAVDTFELQVGEDAHKFNQLPTLFPERIREVTELTRATLNILIDDLDGKTEIHETHPIWLLARTCAPLSMFDPHARTYQDLTRYLGAYVTPNEPTLMKFLRKAARLYPDGRLVGYQGPPEGIITQVKAVFEALRAADITYINSLISFNPQQGFKSQRVRLPRESLRDKEANCIDGTVLMASLLEAISLHPAIVLIPGHAFLAWETWPGTDKWCFLETTLIGSTKTFEEACISAENTAGRYKVVKALHIWSLPELRITYGITPLE